MSYTLDDMIKDVNGEHFYSSDASAFGTVPSKLFLQLPSEFDVKDDKGTSMKDIIAFRDKRLKAKDLSLEVITRNYVSLRNAGHNHRVATFGAILRNQLVHHGYIATDLKNRAVYVDEYDIKEEKVNLPDDFTPLSSVVKFVTDNWQQIVGTVNHVFRVRGHHWKPEFAGLYSRTWNASTIMIPDDVEMPSWEVIARDFLHCFGVKAMHLVVQDAHKRGNLSKGLTVRTDAPAAGNASITTLAAAIIEMGQCKWFPIFQEKFSEAIEEVMKQAVELKMKGVSNHINATLYDMDGKYESPDLTFAKRVAPYVMGWIDNLEPTEPIVQQKAINKVAVGSSAIRNTFSRVLLNEMKNSGTYATVAEYLQN